MPANRGLLILAVLLAVIAVGSAGYHVIEGYAPIDAVYMTVITITTVGFGEVHPLSEQGKLFTIALIIVGVGVAVFSIGIFGEWLIRTMLRTQRMLLRHHLKSDVLAEEDVDGADIFETVKGDNTRIATVRMSAHSKLAGKTKITMLHRTGVIVLGIETGKNRFDVDVPLDKVIKGKKRLLVMGEEPHLKRFEKLARR